MSISLKRRPAGGRNLPSMPSQPFHRRPHGGFLPLAGFMKLFLFFVPPAWEKDFGAGCCNSSEKPNQRRHVGHAHKFAGGFNELCALQCQPQAGAHSFVEIGRCFFPDDADDLPKQPQRLAGLVYGPENRRSGEKIPEQAIFMT